MKLLIITQKVDINDDVLGFFHGWIAEFAKHCEKVTVVCLYKGKHDLPENVKVLSLGKNSIHVIPDTPTPGGIIIDDRESRNNLNQLDPRLREDDSKNFIRKKIKYLSNFYRHIIAERSNYDHVFVHMNPIYVILGWPLWKIWGKKISLWYTHKSVDLKLRIAEKLADKIFTASKSSFRIDSKKLNIVGHGIDVNNFQVESQKRPRVSGRPESPADFEGSKFIIFKIITIGRISPVKDYITLIEAADILWKENLNSSPSFKGRSGGVATFSTSPTPSLNEGGESIKNFQIEIIGGPGTPEQYEYYEHLQEVVRYKQLDKMVYFFGKVPNKEVVSHLQNADIFVNMSHTGSLDKAVLEAMACELPVLSCNEAVADDILANYKEKLYFEKSNSKMLAEKIKALMDINFGERLALGKELREIVVKNHNLEILISRIVAAIQS